MMTTTSNWLQKLKVGDLVIIRDKGEHKSYSVRVQHILWETIHVEETVTGDKPASKRQWVFNARTGMHISLLTYSPVFICPAIIKTTDNAL